MQINGCVTQERRVMQHDTKQDLELLLFSDDHDITQDMDMWES